MSKTQIFDVVRTAEQQEEENEARLQELTLRGNELIQLRGEVAELTELKKLLGAEAERQTATIKTAFERIASLEKQVEGWKAVAENRVGQCETCDGDGLMTVTVGVQAPTGDEIEDLEPCAECGGTGRGEVAALLKDVKDDVWQLLKYIGDAKKEAAKHGRVCGEPLADWIRRSHV